MSALPLPISTLILLQLSDNARHSNGDSALGFDICHMMFELRYWSLWIISTVTAKPASTTQHQTLNLTVPMISSELLFSTTVPITSIDTSDRNRLTVQCDGTKFGYNPDIVDCQSAKGHIPPDSAQRIWKERHQPGQTGEYVPLPFRGMGGISSLVEVSET